MKSKTKLNSVVLVREETIPTERPADCRDKVHKLSNYIIHRPQNPLDSTKRIKPRINSWTFLQGGVIFQSSENYSPEILTKL
jgi:hypothetical protein